MKRLLLLLALFQYAAMLCHAQVTTDDDFTLLTDSTFYHNGVYYLITADKQGVPRNAVNVYDWNPEIEELDFPDTLEVPDEILYPEGTALSRKGNKSTIIIWFFRPQRLIDPDAYRLRRLNLAMDMEIDTDLSMLKFLESVGLPENMKTIPARTFKNCTALKSMRIKKLVEDIGDEAFSGCTNLTSFVIEDYGKLKGIGQYALSGCTSLHTLDLSGCNSLKIYHRAFAGCEQLTSVTLPYSLNYIDSKAFDGCIGLTSINMPSWNDASYYVNDGALYSIYGELRELYIVPLGKGSVVIDTNATNINPEVFKDNSIISTIYLPDNIRSIGQKTFMNCTALRKIRLSERLTSLPDSCFYGCKSLEEINLPESLTNISSGALAACTSLRTLLLPAQINSIAPGSFSDCTALENISVSDWNTTYTSYDGALYHNGYKAAYNFTPYDWHLVCCPAGRTSVTLHNETAGIEESAFKGCKYLTDLNITRKVCWIKPNSFSGCNSLKEFTVDPENEKFRAIDGMIATTESNPAIVQFPTGADEAVINPALLDEDPTNPVYMIVKEGAFHDCTNLKKLTFHRFNIIELPNFTGCVNIREINMLDGFAQTEYYGTGDPQSFESEVIENAIVTVAEPYLSTLPHEEAMNIIGEPWNRFKNVSFIEKAGIEGILQDCETPSWHINGNIISVNNTSGDIIRVFDLSGHLLVQTRGNTITGLESGIFIIAIGNHTPHKIAIHRQ